MTGLRRTRPDDWPSSHVRARSALSDRLDGLLEPSEAGWLDEHLAACSECRATADAYAAQRLELQALRERAPLPPRDLWARTAAAIEAEAAGRSSLRRAAPRRSFVIPSAFIATALAVAVATGLLTSSQPIGPHGGGGSVPQVAAAPSGSAPGGTSAAPEKTPITVALSVDYVGRDAEGRLHVKSTKIDEVCPAGSVQPCDTSGPVEDRAVDIDQNAQAVFGDKNRERLIVVSPPTTDDPGTVAVVTLAPVASPSPSATPTSSASSSGSPAVGSPAPTPSATSSSASPVVPASASPTPTVTAGPTGSIEVTPPSGDTREIAHGVVLVGQTAAYSGSGSWFAFTARPIDGTAGPDIYLWRVGSDAAQRVTDDGRSVFGSWVGDTVVASRAVDPSGSTDGLATNGLRAEAFLLDPASGTRIALPQTGSAWRPVVDPSGRKAVYWAGTLRAVSGPGYAPEGGRLVLGDWAVTDPMPSGSPEATALTGDQSNARHETTIGAGQIDDWDARWDQSGTHLAVWIADHENPKLGRLSLYAVSAFDGTVDLKTPLLDARRAAAGFSISNDGLIWAEPSDDPTATGGTIQLLAWTNDGIGTVETLSGPAIVIR
jgi:hypothetical protein